MSHNLLYFLTSTCDNVSRNHHSSLKVVVSIGNFFGCTIRDTAVPECWGYLINQEVPHDVYSDKAMDCLVCFVHPHSLAGRQLTSRLAGRDFELLHEPPSYLADNKTMSDKEVHEEVIALLDRLTEGYSQPPRKEPKILADIFDYVQEHLEEKILLEHMTKALFISPERIRHVFKEQTGMKLSQYILWERIKAILSAVVEGATFAEASLQYGFFDQSFFNKIFKRAFGLPPSVVTNYCRLIKV